GVPVAQAEVKLTGQNTGTVQKVVTDEAGHFAFTGVAPGDYVLSAKVEGFEKAQLQLKVGTSPTPAQRLRLKVATVTEEITVSANKNPYSAEFGRPGKGRIEVVTRGGSQRHFHSRFTFTFRDANLDARNAFADVRPPRRRELFEGAIDGPLVRDKVTFFLGGEYLKDNDTAFVAAETPSGR